MTGHRHWGMRVVIPPGAVEQPTRVNCRYQSLAKMGYPPPFMEREALASRVVEISPAGERFRAPVLIEIPHFASTSNAERETIILRSDDGETWGEHVSDYVNSGEIYQDVVTSVKIQDSALERIYDVLEVSPGRIIRILTSVFPKYFAIITRVREQVRSVDQEGGKVVYDIEPRLRATFPRNAVRKKIKVALQAQTISLELVKAAFGRSVEVSRMVAVEPRKRKFHEPIFVSIPLPCLPGKASTANIRLLCSITGSTEKAAWQDVTGTTPLELCKDVVHFSTKVSGIFWLLLIHDKQRTPEAAMTLANRLYEESILVPYLARLSVFCRENFPKAWVHTLRVYCMTDDKAEKVIQSLQGFRPLVISGDVEVTHSSAIAVTLGGNLMQLRQDPFTAEVYPTSTLRKGGDVKEPFIFRAFEDNCLTLLVQAKDKNSPVAGSLSFARKLTGVSATQQLPLCSLGFDFSSDSAGHCIITKGAETVSVPLPEPEPLDGPPIEQPPQMKETVDDDDPYEKIDISASKASTLRIKSDEKLNEITLAEKVAENLNKKAKKEAVEQKKTPVDERKKYKENTNKKKEEPLLNGKSDEVFEEVCVTPMPEAKVKSETKYQPKGKMKKFLPGDLNCLRSSYAKQQGVKEVKARTPSPSPNRKDTLKSSTDKKISTTAGFNDDKKAVTVTKNDQLPVSDSIIADKDIEKEIMQDIIDEQMGELKYEEEITGIVQSIKDDEVPNKRVQVVEEICVQTYIAPKTEKESTTVKKEKTPQAKKKGKKFSVNDLATVRSEYAKEQGVKEVVMVNELPITLTKEKVVKSEIVCPELQPYSSQEQEEKQVPEESSGIFDNVQDKTQEKPEDINDEKTFDIVEGKNVIKERSILTADKVTLEDVSVSLQEKKTSRVTLSEKTYEKETNSDYKIAEIDNFTSCGQIVDKNDQMASSTPSIHMKSSTDDDIIGSSSPSIHVKTDRDDDIIGFDIKREEECEKEKLKLADEALWRPAPPPFELPEPPKTEENYMFVLDTPKEISQKAQTEPSISSEQKKRRGNFIKDWQSDLKEFFSLGKKKKKSSVSKASTLTLEQADLKVNGDNKAKDTLVSLVVPSPVVSESNDINEKEPGDIQIKVEEKNNGIKEVEEYDKAKQVGSTEFKDKSDDGNNETGGGKRTKRDRKARRKTNSESSNPRLSIPSTPTEEDKVISQEEVSAKFTEQRSISQSKSSKDHNKKFSTNDLETTVTKEMDETLQSKAIEELEKNYVNKEEKSNNINEERVKSHSESSPKLKDERRVSQADESSPKVTYRRENSILSAGGKPKVVVPSPKGIPKPIPIRSSKNRDSMISQDSFDMEAQPVSPVSEETEPLIINREKTEEDQPQDKSEDLLQSKYEEVPQSKSEDLSHIKSDHQKYEKEPETEEFKKAVDSFDLLCQDGDSIDKKKKNKKLVPTSSSLDVEENKDEIKEWEQLVRANSLHNQSLECEIPTEANGKNNEKKKKNRKKNKRGRQQEPVEITSKDIDKVSMPPSMSPFEESQLIVEYESAKQDEIDPASEKYQIMLDRTKHVDAALEETVDFSETQMDIIRKTKEAHDAIQSSLMDIEEGKEIVRVQKHSLGVQGGVMVERTTTTRMVTTQSMDSEEDEDSQIDPDSLKNVDGAPKTRKGSKRFAKHQNSKNKSPRTSVTVVTESGDNEDYLSKSDLTSRLEETNVQMKKLSSTLSSVVSEEWPDEEEVVVSGRPGTSSHTLTRTTKITVGDPLDEVIESMIQKPEPISTSQELFPSADSTSPHVYRAVVVQHHDEVDSIQGDEVSAMRKRLGLDQTDPQ